MRGRGRGREGEGEKRKSGKCEERVENVKKKESEKSEEKRE